MRSPIRFSALSLVSTSLVATGVLLLALLLAAPGPAAAGEVGGVEMPEMIAVDGEQLVLNGMALRSRLFFKVYVAGLYLPHKEPSAKAILSADQERRTVLHFLRDVSSDQVCTAWKDGLEANTPDASTQLWRQFDQLCGMMADVSDGDTMVFTYVPGEGTTVEVKGADKGTLEGKEFADALWACWIGEEPGPGEDFKQALLGND